MDFFIATFLKMFFVMTPFFVLSVFLTVTNEASLHEKRHLAIRVTFSVIVISLVLMYFGRYIFAIFGVTLDAFRIGAGALLFMSAVGLVNGNKDSQKLADFKLSELAVVPLALPITVGPATIGVLLVMVADNDTLGEFLLESSAMTCSILVVGLMLYFYRKVSRQTGYRDYF